MRVNDPLVLARIRRTLPARFVAAYTPARHVPGSLLLAHGVRLAALRSGAQVRAVGSLAATRTSSNARTSPGPAVPLFSLAHSDRRANSAQPRVPMGL
jgi:hypothetical protein